MFNETQLSNGDLPKPPTIEKMREDIALASDDDVIFTSIPKNDANSVNSNYSSRSNIGNELDGEQSTSSDHQGVAMLDNTSSVPAEIYDQVMMSHPPLGIWAELVCAQEGVSYTSHSEIMKHKDYILMNGSGEPIWRLCTMYFNGTNAILIKKFVDDNQKMAKSIPKIDENLQRLSDVAVKLDEAVAAVRSQTSPKKTKNDK